MQWGERKVRRGGSLQHQWESYGDGTVRLRAALKSWVRDCYFLIYLLIIYWGETPSKVLHWYHIPISTTKACAVSKAWLLNTFFWLLLRTLESVTLWVVGLHVCPTSLQYPTTLGVCSFHKTQCLHLTSNLKPWLPAEFFLIEVDFPVSFITAIPLGLTPYNSLSSWSSRALP